VTDTTTTAPMPIDTTLWCVNITGPDDVIAVASRAEAIDLAARFNNWWMKRFPAAELHPYDPTTWAVPIPYPNSPEGHAASCGDLGEYEWLRSTPPASTADIGGALPDWSIPRTAKWCQPGDVQDAQRFLVRFEDPDCRDRVFTDKGEAVAFYKRACISWNCWLFAAMPVSSALASSPSPDQVRKDTLDWLSTEIVSVVEHRKPLPMGREHLGREVRTAWVRWAELQPHPKPSWLAPYDKLAEPDKEADRLIGEYIALGVLQWFVINDPTVDHRTRLAADPHPTKPGGRV
jgi:hypothetical protein